MTNQYMVVFVTAPNVERAERIAAAVVEERLAACVNILPGCRSIYRWQGELHNDEEALMIVKSSRAAFAALERRIVELHDYDVPEVIAVEIADGSPGYLSFLRDSLSP
jgi:uncharacterized protein involved in tolerance to divalent cations